MEKKRDSFFLSDKKQKKENPHQQMNQEPNNKNKQKQFNNKNKRQEQFNKNRAGLANTEKQDNEKKPFDKKAYRLKKYSKKYKLEQWEEQRKKKLLRNYYKDVQNDTMSGSYKPINFDEDTTDSNQVGRFVRHPDLIEKENSKPIKEIEVQNKKEPFKRAKDRYDKIKQQKLQKQQEIEKAKQERMEKIQEYKKKKQERFKKLSKKTKKGQPVMTGRLELLLEKIQNDKE